MKSHASSFVALTLAIACGRPERAASPARGQDSLTTTVAIGEEPLETETLGAEEVQTLAREKLPDVPPETRPCAWARAWNDPDRARPLLAGVGGVPSPARLREAAIRVPVKEPKPEGEIVVELVIRPDGSVGEAHVLQTTTPPWPEAENAVLEAVRAWSFEPPTLEGTPIAVCTTVLIQP